MAVLVNPPCVIFEDDHLLVVNKPAGWNTHSPAPYAGEGIYEWLKNREPRWAKLAIIHRLDKETSGLLIFSKTPEANRSLTEQFTEGRVRKEYILQSFNAPPKPKMLVRSNLKRAGERYVSQPGASSGQTAITEFELLKSERSLSTLIARPRTGRTHQIRVHASESGFAIRGDALYGGAGFDRVCLHAARLEFRHPVTGENLVFENQPNFEAETSAQLRVAIISPEETNAFRIRHGEVQVDRFGDFVLGQAPGEISPEERFYLKALNARGAYHKTTTSQVRGKTPEETSPKHVAGTSTSGPFAIRENNVNYEINFSEGYSVGIFLDQRDNRRRLLTNYIAPDFFLSDRNSEVGPAVPSGPPQRSHPLADTQVLNTFAYTCAFSVCAALSGARVTSLDLSKKYLDWGRRNFQLNNVDPAEHDFIYGDVFDWLKRLAKKRRQFEIVLLDPPTFSNSKESGLFRAENDYPRLVTDALKVLKPGGVLFASSNAARWAPEDFVQSIHQTIAKANRKILREHYVPQPPDFPISRTQPAYLKTLWLKID